MDLKKTSEYNYDRETIPHSDSDVMNAMPRRIIYFPGKPYADTLYFQGLKEELESNLGAFPTTENKEKYGPGSVNERIFNGIWERASKKKLMEKLLK